MQRLVIKLRTVYGHPDIIVWASTDLAPVNDWISRYFEEIVAQGSIFKAEETVQIGWMIVKLKMDQRGDLEVWEPSFDSVPIRWTRGVDNTLRHLTLQNEICDRVHIEPEYPSLVQSGVIPIDFLENKTDFEMIREPSTGRDSGWVFQHYGAMSIPAKHCSLYNIAIVYSEIVPFVALPPGSSVSCSEAGIRITCDVKSLSSNEDEFLKRVANSLKLA